MRGAMRGSPLSLWEREGVRVSRQPSSEAYSPSRTMNSISRSGLEGSGVSRHTAVTM
jgi:hypothetical protein